MRVLPLFLMWSLCVFASDDFFELTLEQLTNIPVNVASKSVKTLATAPASVSVYTAASLSKLNRYNLNQLAEITPGYSSYSIYGEKVFVTRAQRAGSFENNKHLVIVDGINVNHARANKGSTENELPLYFAERVEFLRGPDSALHGVGAFYGVVNIHSKHKSVREQRFSFANDHQGFSGMINAVGESGKIFASHFQKSAVNESVGPSFTNAQLNRDNQTSQFLYASKYLNLKDQDIDLGFIYLNKRGGLGEHWMGDYSSQANELSWTTMIPFVKWRYSLSDQDEIESVLQRSISAEKGYWAPFTAVSIEEAPGTGSVFQAYNVEVIKSQLSFIWQHQRENIGWQLGVEYQVNENQQANSFILSIIADDVDDGDPATTPLQYTELSDGQVVNQGVYINSEFEIPKLPEVSFSFGLRMDQGRFKEDEFQQFSPRLSAVWSIYKNWTGKLSYRTALRTPGLKEYSLNNEARASMIRFGVSDDILKDLRPERFMSGEVSLVYQSPKVFSQISIFVNTTNHSLDGSQITIQDQFNSPQLINIFRNDSEKIEARGAEVESRYYVNKNITLNGNASWAKARNNNVIVSDVPELVVNTWGTWQIDRWTHTGLLHYIKNYHNGLGRDYSGGHSVDVISQYTSSKYDKISFAIHNISNEKNFYPLKSEDRILMPRRYFNFSWVTHF